MVVSGVVVVLVSCGEALLLFLFFVFLNKCYFNAGSVVWCGGVV